MNKINIVKKVKAPKGFKFIVRKNFYNNWQVNLYKVYKSHSVPIGNIELIRSYGKTYETHSNLESEFHNKGLGALMYAKAIEWCLLRGYKCKSSGYPSGDAIRVWKGETIRKFFAIKARPTYAGSEAHTYHASFKKLDSKNKK